MRIFLCILSVIMFACTEATPESTPEKQDTQSLPDIQNIPEVSVPKIEVTKEPKVEEPKPEPVIEVTKDPDFRNTKWGMSIEKVKSLEKAKFIESVTTDTGLILVYEDNLLNISVSVIYIFAEDTLVRAKYLSLEQHSSDNQYFNDFDKFATALSDKYGSKEVDTLWTDDLYKRDPDDWGKALARGDLTLSVSWTIPNEQAPKTSIFLYLMGDNYRIRHGVEYNSLEYADKEEKIKTQVNNQKL
jgi:hypothetical protein